MAERTTILMVAPNLELVEVTQSEVVNKIALRDNHINKAINDDLSLVGTYLMESERDKYFRQIEDVKPNEENNEGGNSKRTKKVKPNTGADNGVGENNAQN